MLYALGLVPAVWTFYLGANRGQRSASGQDYEHLLGDGR